MVSSKLCAGQQYVSCTDIYLLDLGLWIHCSKMYIQLKTSKQILQLERT